METFCRFFLLRDWLAGWRSLRCECLAFFMGLSLASVSHAQEAARREDRIFLRNGDQLHGGLLGWTSSEILTWQHPRFSAPLAFPVVDVKRVVFAKPASPGSGNAKCTVKCLNGDWFTGKILSLDEASLHFEAEGSLLWRIPRAQLEWVYLGEKQPAACVELRDHLEGWETSGIWKRHPQTGLLYGGTLLGKEMAPVPDYLECTLAARLATEDSFTLNFFVESALRPNLEPGTFALTFTQNNISVNFNHGEDTESHEFSFVPPPPKVSLAWPEELVGWAREMIAMQGLPPLLGQAPSVMMPWTVLYQQSAGRLQIYLGQERVGECKFKKRQAPPARCRSFSLQMYPSNPAEPLALSRFALRPWSGFPPGQTLQKQAVRLAGGESREGLILDISENRIKLQTNAGEEIIPVGQARLLTFAHPLAEAVLRNAGQPRLTLAHGGEVAAEVTGWAAGQLLCQTPWGENRLPAALVKDWSAPGALPPPGLFDAGQDRLYFTQEDRLSGELDFPSDAAALRWKTSAQPQGLDIPGAEVEEVRRREGAKAGAIAPEVSGLIRFKNGDLLPGRVTRWEAQQAVIEGAATVRMTFPQDQISAIYYPPKRKKSGMLFHPKNKMDGKRSSLTSIKWSRQRMSGLSTRIGRGGNGARECWECPKPWTT